VSISDASRLSVAAMSILLGFALAKAMEGQGDIAQAFAAFQRANAERRASVEWGGVRERRRDGGDPGRVRRGIACTLDPGLGHELIQVASLPRSGSTPVEQILASHPQVEGTGEIGDMPQVADAEARRRSSAFPSWVPDVSSQELVSARPGVHRPHRPLAEVQATLHRQEPGELASRGSDAGVLAD